MKSGRYYPIPPTKRLYVVFNPASKEKEKKHTITTRICYYYYLPAATWTCLLLFSNGPKSHCGRGGGMNTRSILPDTYTKQ